MSRPQLTFRDWSFIAGGVLALAIAAYGFWPRTAPPGLLPAVAPEDRTSLPLDGVALPALSTADLEKVKRGEVVEIKAGQGSIQIGPVEGAPK